MQEIQKAGIKTGSAPLFATSFVSFCVFAAMLVAPFPLEGSIATIFLFAGPHNRCEFRYFLARMPARWGKSRFYYSFGIAGAAVLTAAYLAIYFGSGNWLWSANDWQIAASVWNTALILWIGFLFYLRGHQKPKADWSWAFPAAFFLAATVWLAPAYWSLALVYLHPLIAFWSLERQIGRRRFVARRSAVGRLFARLRGDAGRLFRFRHRLRSGGVSVSGEDALAKQREC